jgi:hypothetical protein
MASASCLGAPDAPDAFDVLDRVPGRPLLLEALLEPRRCVAFDLGDWDLLVRQAVRCDLLARLEEVLASQDLLADVPPMPRRHLAAARLFAAKHVRDVRHELSLIHDALKPLGSPVVLLKGAAYLAAELPFSLSRLFSDIDILVPRANLQDVESALFARGWVTLPMDSYDKTYYRDFMHELPPMVHTLRGTTIDIHHTIIPPTSTGDLEPTQLFAASVETSGPFRVLGPEDMVLHSATHLFHEGELEQGFKGLVDVAELIGHFGRGDRAAFIERLQRRAAGFGLSVPVDHALHYTALILGQPAPLQPGPLRPLMDTLFRRGLGPCHESCEDSWSGLARLALYVRGHYLRMPPRLLVPHLLRKARMRLFPGRSLSGVGNDGASEPGRRGGHCRADPD